MTRYIMTLLAAILSLAGAQANDFYHWTDAQGVTHYSQQPPPDSANAPSSQVTQLPVPNPSSAPQSPSALSTLDKPLAWTAEQLCRQAQDNMADLASHIPQENRNLAKRHRLLSEAQRQQELQLAGQHVEHYCRQLR